MNSVPVGTEHACWCVDLTVIEVQYRIALFEAVDGCLEATFGLWDMEEFGRGRDLSRVHAALALPEARDIALDQVRERLIPLVRVVREEIRENGSIDDARELGRRLDAFQRLVTDREARGLLAAEARRTEVLVGYLLGDAVVGNPAITHASVIAEVPREDREARGLLAAEARRTEVLVGYLLGSAVMGRPKGESLSAFKLSMDPADKNRFRLLADNADLVEQFLKRNVQDRALRTKLLHWNYEREQDRADRTWRNPDRPEPPSPCPPDGGTRLTVHVPTQEFLELLGRAA